MADSRDSDSGIYTTQYSLGQVLAVVSTSERTTAKTVETSLGCTRRTALDKLHRLEEIGVMASDEIGSTFDWEVSSEFSEPELSCDDETISRVLSDITYQFTEELVGQSDLTHDIPTVEEWLSDRGVPDEADTHRFALRLALYRRFLRAVLYTLHSIDDADLVKLDLDNDWNATFDNAYEVTGDEGLQPLPIDQLSSHLSEEMDSVLLALRTPLSSAENPASVLANSYENIVSQEARREMGQFATPTSVARCMASWANSDPRSKILDPGIGAGQLAAQVLTAKRSAGVDSPLRQIVGVDTDPIAISMASISLKLLDGNESPQLWCQDFIQYSPLTYENGSYEREQFDGVIANPPYSRHQSIENRTKCDINEIVSRETGYNLSGTTPLYGYFLAHAGKFVTPGGKLAFLIPSRILDAKFGTPLKKYLLNEFGIDGIVQLEEETDVFPEIRAEPCIFFLTRGEPSRDKYTRFVRVSQWPEVVDAHDFLSTDSLSEYSEVEFATELAQELLSPSERWSQYFSETEVESHPELVEFGSIATINRGIATGKNDFFCLSKETLEEDPIPEEYRKRIIRSPKQISGFTVTKEDWNQWRKDDEDVWLLYCRTAKGDSMSREEIESEIVLKYLRKGENEGVTDGYLCSKRSPWFKVESQEPAQILGRYMNRNGFRFFRNDGEFRTLNNIHQVRLEFDCDQSHVNALLAYLNSTFVEKELSKHSDNYYGLEKLEIGQLESVPVIDPRELSDGQLNKLDDQFRELCKNDEERRDRLLQEIESTINEIRGTSAVSGDTHQ